MTGSGLVLIFSQEERVTCRARPPGGINTHNRIGFRSDHEPFAARGGKLTGYLLTSTKVDLSSHLFINLTAAANTWR